MRKHRRLTTRRDLVDLWPNKSWHENSCQAGAVTRIELCGSGQSAWRRTRIAGVDVMHRKFDPVWPTSMTLRSSRIYWLCIQRRWAEEVAAKPFVRGPALWSVDPRNSHRATLGQNPFIHTWRNLSARWENIADWWLPEFYDGRVTARLPATTGYQPHTTTSNPSHAHAFWPRTPSTKAKCAWIDGLCEPLDL